MSTARVPSLTGMMTSPTRVQSRAKRMHASSRARFSAALAVTLLISQLFITQAWAAKNIADEKAVYDLCMESEKYSSSGNYSRVEAALKQAAALDETSYSSYVHLKLADCYRAQKKYQNALAETDSALKFDPNHDAAIYTAAMIYNDLNKTDECIERLKQYIRVTKNAEMKKSAQQYLKKIGSFAELNKATKLIESGKHKEALKLLDSDSLSDPSPYSAAVHSNKSFVLRELGQSERAIEEGKKALDADPNDKNCVYNLAIAYQDLAKFDEAIASLKRYAQMETDPQARSAAETFLHELEIDRTQFNSADNKKPDYFDQIKQQNHVLSWPPERLPLKIYVAPGKNVKGFQSSFPSFVPKALDAWCLASGKKLNYKMVNDPAKADIKLSWTKEKLVGNDLKDDRLKAGLTNLISTQGQITDATVQIRTVNPFNPEENVSSGQCASVVVHELGHALGLGHSTYIYDVMYFRASTKQSGLPTKRDNATLARLYKNYPGVEFIAKAEPSSGPPVKYLPPPTFVPPKLTGTKQIVPPLFVPPPLVAEKKLEPPLFTPPPLQKKSPSVELVPSKPPSGTSTRPASVKPNVPLFVPPPIEKRKPAAPGPKLFVPPPLKQN